jgi:hypothetical protein
VLTEHGSALGLVTESLTTSGQPAELGYHAVLTVEPIYNCLFQHDVMPQVIHDQWRTQPGEKSFWESLKTNPALQRDGFPKMSVSEFLTE